MDSILLVYIRSIRFRISGALICLAIVFQTQSQSAEISTETGVELEFWIVNSSDLLVNRRPTEYKDKESLSNLIKSFYEPPQVVKATLVTSCETSDVLLDEILGAFDEIGLVEGNSAEANQHAYVLNNQCGLPNEGDGLTEKFILHSGELGRDFSVSISLPENYSPNNKYPLVFFTDAEQNYAARSLSRSNVDGMQEIVAQLTNGELMPEVVLAGIGYPARNHRTKDFTPTASPYIGDNRFGGAQAFATFIEKEVKPFIYSKAEIDSLNETYVGHSYGGLFGAYVLFSKPQLFDNFVLSSPPLSFDNNENRDGISFTFEEDYMRKNTDMAKSVYISAGSEDLGTIKWDAKKMYDNLASRNYESLRLRFDLFEGEGHMSVVKPAYSEGLSFIFAKR